MHIRLPKKMRPPSPFLKALIIITITSLFTNLNIGKILNLGDKLNLNLFYILLPFLFLLLPKYKSSLKTGAFQLLSLFTIFNLIAYIRYGFSFEGIRIIIAILSFLVGFAIAKSQTDDQISKIFNVTGIVVIILICLRVMIYPGLSFQILLGNRAALSEYPFLTTGGQNIEVTYLIFLSMLCGNKRISNAILYSSIILSVMYMSRVGIILFLLILTFRVYKQLSTQKFILAMMALIISVPLALSIFSPKTVERFTDVSQEVEYGEQGVGRIGFYIGAQELLNKNILGFGVGNTLDLMSASTGVTYKENNVHNIYLQILLDFGIISFAGLLCFSAWLIKKSINRNLSNRYILLSAAYLIVGFIQFTGLDALGWLCIGIAYPSILAARKARSNKTSGLEYS